MPISTFFRLSLAIPALLALLLLGACDPERDFATGPTRTDPVSIELGHADRANVQLNIAAGELDLRGGSPKLLTGNLEYNVPQWKPEIESSTSGAHATITIRQPQHNHTMIGNRHYTWDLALNNKVMYDLGVNCGAGRAQLDLGELDLRSLEVQMGAGQVDLDLRGHPTRDYDVTISGGVGQATIYLPKDIGIRAEAHGGIGSIDVSGLPKKGGFYENDLYNSSKVNLHLTVQGGIGQIRIIG